MFNWSDRNSNTEMEAEGQSLESEQFVGPLRGVARRSQLQRRPGPSWSRTRQQSPVPARSGWRQPWSGGNRPWNAGGWNQGGSNQGGGWNQGGAASYGQSGQWGGQPHHHRWGGGAGGGQSQNPWMFGGGQLPGWLAARLDGGGDPGGAMPDMGPPPGAGFAPPTFASPTVSVPVPVPTPPPVSADAAPDPAAAGGPPMGPPADAPPAPAGAGELVPWLERRIDHELAPFGQRKHHRWQDLQMESEIPTNSAGKHLLRLQIPDAPYSDDAFHKVQFGFDLAEWVHATLEIFAVEFLGILGPIGAGLMGAVAPFLAIGAGYAEAWADIARDRTKLGFAYGVVLGADSRPWTYVKPRYWRNKPDADTWDDRGGVIAMNSFNLGLAAGFIQGRDLLKSPGRTRFLWGSLAATLTPGDRNYYGVDRKTWLEGMWKDWYERIAAAFITQYAKD
jgi:hypothetical protein